MAFNVNGTFTTITSEGNMGIGTLSPSANFTFIAAGSNAVISIAQTGSGAALNVISGDVQIADNLNVDGVITGIFDSIVATGNTSFDSGVLFVDSVGNKVGVNTTTPHLALNVTGDIAATGNVLSDVNMMVGANTVWHTGTLDLGSNTAWHSGNDGDGSTLDADLLDGLHGAYYATIAQSAFAQANTATTQAALKALKTGDTFTGTVVFGLWPTMNVDVTGNRVGILRNPDVNTPLGILVDTLHFTSANIGMSLTANTNSQNNTVIIDMSPTTFDVGYRSAQIVAYAETSSTSTALIFKTGAGSVPAERMRINRNGRVTINRPNQDNASAQLDVAGNVIISQEINVGSGGSFTGDVYVGGLLNVSSTINTTARITTTNGVSAFHFNHGASGGLKNLIINPFGQVHERPNTDIATDGNTDMIYFDRWYVLKTGTTDVLCVNIETPVDGIPNMMRMWNFSAGGLKIAAAQIVSSEASRMMRGKEITAKAIMQRGGAGACRIAVLNWLGTKDSVDRNVIADWTSSTYDVGGFFQSSHLALVTQNSATFGAQTLGTIHSTGTVQTTCNNLIFLVFVSTNETALTGHMDWAGWMMPGNVPETYPEIRPIALEQDMCRYYYECTGVDLLGYQYATGYATATNEAAFTINYSPKRVTPNISNTVITNFKIVRGSGPENLTDASWARQSRKSASLSVTTADTNLTAGEGVESRANGTTSYIEIDAEI